MLFQLGPEAKDLLMGGWPGSAWLPGPTGQTLAVAGMSAQKALPSTSWDHQRLVPVNGRGAHVHTHKHGSPQAGRMTHRSKMRKHSASSSSLFPLASSFIWRTIMTRNSSKSMVPLPVGRRPGQQLDGAHHPLPPPLLPAPLLTIFIHLLNDGVQLLFGGRLAQHAHHCAQLLGADVSATVRVKHVEGGLEFCSRGRVRGSGWLASDQASASP